MLEKLLAEGMTYHDSETERLAGELEAAAAAPVEPALLVPYIKLSTHTIGEHLGDWPRARRLVERVLGGQTPSAQTAMAWARLAIARFLDGDALGATEAELACLTAAGADFRAALIESRFMLVATLVSAKRRAEAAALYERALALARAAADAAPHRAIAVASNNLASELVEASSRSPVEDALMKTAADAAHEFWLLCGTWVNEERALYLDALVANALGHPQEALAHVEQALAIIAANGEEPVDAAFLGLARARALGLIGDTTGQARELALADAGAAAWDDPGLKSWFADERAKAAAPSP